jgi:peptidoglycan/xylan/chitin deacetylase (PgdA/CDA1 family)
MRAKKGAGIRASLVLAAVITFWVYLNLSPAVSSQLTGLLMGSHEKPELSVSLSFDIEDWEDGNETLAVPLIIELLDEHGAKGTFFIAGKAAEKNSGLVREIHSAGHELGLHTHEHLFPIFDRDHAAVVAGSYDTSTDYVWNMSYKTTQAFRKSLEDNRAAISQAIGEDAGVSVFRSPCLVSNWGVSWEYFEVLKQSGIRVDSSFKQAFPDRYSYPLEPFETNDIFEVPVTRGDDILESEPWNILKKMQKAGAPVVFFMHPRKFDVGEIEKLDSLLTEMEIKYDTNYVTIGEIADIYRNA